MTQILREQLFSGDRGFLRIFPVDNQQQFHDAPVAFNIQTILQDENLGLCNSVGTFDESFSDSIPHKA